MAWQYHTQHYSQESRCHSPFPLWFDRYALQTLCLLSRLKCNQMRYQIRQIAACNNLEDFAHFLKPKEYYILVPQDP